MFTFRHKNNSVFIIDSESRYFTSSTFVIDLTQCAIQYITKMSLATRYRQFLNRPSSDLLSASANLHYLPTTTTINSADAIVKHFNAQNQVLRKKNEDFKNVVEGPNSICVETETTLEFNMGGGAYLPGIDDHLLADRSVTLPIVCRARAMS